MVKFADVICVDKNSDFDRQTPTTTPSAPTENTNGAMNASAQASQSESAVTHSAELCATFLRQTKVLFGTEKTATK